MKTSIKTLLLACCVSSVFFSCASDEGMPAGPKKQMTFTATSGEAAPKTNASDRMYTRLVEGNQVEFNAGDAISVFDYTTWSNNKFVTGTSGKTVKFDGFAPEDEVGYIALYPYQESARFDVDFICTIPAEQHIMEGTTFDPQAAVSIGYTLKEDMMFYFKNLTSMVKFTTTEDLAKIVFKGNNNEGVAGEVLVSAIVEDDGPTAGCGTDPVETITLLPAAGEDVIPAGTYFINVMPNKFTNGFALECYKSGSTTPDFARNVATSIELKRSKILNVGEISSFDAAGKDFVDLGIEVNGNKVIWATMNVGASAPEGFGYHFLWGETSPRYSSISYSEPSTPGEEITLTNVVWKSGYNFDWYGSAYSDHEEWWNGLASTYDLTKSFTLPLAADAAHVNWGGSWMMPTLEEVEALFQNTTQEYTYVNKILCAKFTSKVNGKYILFPAAGSFENDHLNYKENGYLKGNLMGVYYSSTWTSDEGFGLVLYDCDVEPDQLPIYGVEEYTNPCSVRAVAHMPASK